MTPRLILRMLALALPVVFAAGLAGWHAVTLANAQSWRIAIEGYDPRDLLRGHYIVFDYDWNWSSGARNCETGTPCCLCLTHDETPFVEPLVAAQQCVPDLADRCDGVIRTSWRGGRDTLGRQFFLDERHARAVQRMIWSGETELAVDLKVTRDGTALIEGLVIDGLPYIDVLAEQEARADETDKDP